MLWPGLRFALRSAIRASCYAYMPTRCSQMRMNSLTASTPPRAHIPCCKSFFENSLINLSLQILAL